MAQYGVSEKNKAPSGRSLQEKQEHVQKRLRYQQAGINKPAFTQMRTIVLEDLPTFSISTSIWLGNSK